MAVSCLKDKKKKKNYQDQRQVSGNTWVSTRPGLSSYYHIIFSAFNIIQTFLVIYKQDDFAHSLDRVRSGIVWSPLIAATYGLWLFAIDTPPLISLSSSLVQSIRYIKSLQNKLSLLHRIAGKFSCPFKYWRTSGAILKPRYRKRRREQLNHVFTSIDYVIFHEPRELIISSLVPKLEWIF